MSHDVLVLKDSNGDIFVITADLLRLAQVKTPDHIELVKKLTGNSALTCKPATKTSIFNVVGSFEMKEDKFLQPKASLGITYAAPRVVFELVGAGAAMPS